MIVLLTLLLLGICVGFQHKEYPLVDIQYSVPYCSPGGMENLYGKVETETTLFDYNAMRLKTTLLPNITSCRLCQLNPLYCNLTVGNDFYGMANDVPSNMRVLLGDGSEEFHFLFTPESPTAEMIGNNSWCGKRVRLTFLAYFTLRSPVHRDFLLTLANPPHSAQPCHTFLSKTRLCNIAPLIFSLDFPYTNCLEEGPILSLPNPLERRSPFYYSHHLEKVPKDVRLCGESWYSIMKRANLNTYCDPELLLYVKPKAWYEAAVILISARLAPHGEKELWILQNMLERSCTQRELEVSLEHTLFFPFVEVLGGGLVCLNRTNFTQLPVEKNITLPFYVRNYQKWFYQWFHYVLEPTESMRVKASLLLTYPFVLTAIGLVSLGFTLYHVYFRKHQDYQPLSK